VRSTLLGDEIQTARNIREWIPWSRGIASEFVRVASRDTSGSVSLTRIRAFPRGDSASNIKIYVTVGNNRCFTALRNESKIRPWRLLYFSYHFTSVSGGKSHFHDRSKIKKKKCDITDSGIPHTYLQLD